VVLLLALCAGRPAFARGTKAAASGKGHKRSFLRHGAWKHHGQQKIDADRARDIQTALIREKYLDGEPSGVWDQHTKDAMTRYQEDHGWQTKSLPDSRALIQLGLGPKHENLINPSGLSPNGNEPLPAAAFSGRPLN
jgi:hypothetical protein